MIVAAATQDDAEEVVVVVIDVDELVVDVVGTMLVSVDEVELETVEKGPDVGEPIKQAHALEY